MEYHAFLDLNVFLTRKGALIPDPGQACPNGPGQGVDLKSTPDIRLSRPGYPYPYPIPTPILSLSLTLPYP